VVLLALVALSASGVQSAAAVALQNTLNANWRGAYDILVTAKGSAVGATGYLAPNSFSSGETMTLADVTRIRAVSEVGVAAPIGQVVLPVLSASNVSVELPVADMSATASPQAFLLSATYATNDGLGKRVALTQDTDVVIDNTPEPPLPAAKPCRENGVKVDITKFPLLCVAQQVGGPLERGSISSTIVGSDAYGSGGVAEDGTYLLGLFPVPQGSTVVTLVDPAAERALLGKAGAFLAPLEALHPSTSTTDKTMTAWAKSNNSVFARDYLTQAKDQAAYMSGATSTPPTAIAQQFNDQVTAFDKLHPGISGKPDNRQEVAVPMLTAEGGAADLSVSVTIHSLGSAPANSGANGFPYDVPTGSGTKVGTVTADASSLLNPFAVKQVTLPWPGSTLPKSLVSTTFVTHYVREPGVAGPSSYLLTKHADGTVSATLTAPGYLSPTPPENQDIPDPFALVGDGTAVGKESVYTPVSLVANQSQVAADVVPVGTFSSRSVDPLQSSLSYVPLGAYQSIGSTVTTSSGTKSLKASISGLGLVSPRTVAIASIASAAAWNQKAPVDAVRVRVAGISGYSTTAVNKVVDVAAAIKDLGFTATVVAGSSPTDIPVTVSGYAFGATAGSAQRVGKLGTVTQQWSELGAAARADVAISTASLSILGIALGSTAFLLGAVQFVSVPRRRAQSSIMREIGWTRGRVRRWMSAEELPAIVVVVAAGAGAIALSGGSRLSIEVASAGVFVVVATSLVAVLAGSNSRRSQRAARASSTRVPRRRLLLRGTTTTGFGIRQVRIHLFTTVTLLIANLVVAASAAGLVELFLSGRRAAGASLFAQFTTAQATLPQVVLGATGILAGVILAVLMRRIDLARRAPQWQAMRAMGWAEAELRSAQRIESGTMAIPALILALLACGYGAILLHVSPVWLYATVGGIASVLVSMAILFVRRKAINA
jgi:hypothetical protein